MAVSISQNKINIWRDSEKEAVHLRASELG